MPIPQNPFILYGAGGHARVILEAARAAGHEISFVLDDNPSVAAMSGLELLPPTEALWAKLKTFRFVVGIGNNDNRARIFQELMRRGGTPQTIVHPFTAISPSAKLGQGVVVMAGVVVNADARIADNCILNTRCSIDHDCKIGAHSHICPGVSLAGDVAIGQRSMIGIGSCCIQGVTIGANVILGAGSVVVRDLPDNCTAYGNPACPR